MRVGSDEISRGDAVNLLCPGINTLERGSRLDVWPICVYCIVLVLVDFRYLFASSDCVSPASPIESWSRTPMRKNKI